MPRQARGIFYAAGVTAKIRTGFADIPEFRTAANARGGAGWDAFQ
jgi:hypothetical protein